MYACAVDTAFFCSTDSVSDPVRWRRTGIQFKIALSGTFGFAFIPIISHTLVSASLLIWLEVMETGRQASGANINVTAITVKRSLHTNRECASV